MAQVFDIKERIPITDPTERARVSPPETKADATVDLRSPALYLNRELTWLEFNKRVLYQARDPEVPLLERLKFIAILGTNINEFFMKRIGGLKQQVGAGIKQLTVDGRTPQEQITESYARVRELESDQRRALRQILDELEQRGIRIVAYADLTADEQHEVRQHYFKNIFPLVTPQAMDPAHPFPFISNLSLNLLVTLRYPGDTDPSMARVKAPVGTGIPRFLPVGGPRRFVPLEQVIAGNLDLLFPGMEVDGCELFRATRNANTEGDEEEADDLLALIESELRERRFAPIVRLEVSSGMSSLHRGMLAAEFGLNSEDVFEVDWMMATRDLFEITSIDDPEPSMPRVKAPVGTGIPRFLPVGGPRRFVPLEQVIAGNLDLLFPGMEVDGCEHFRVTRNANTEGDEEAADDLLALIESELRERRFAPIVRLEVSSGMSSLHRGMLAAEFGLSTDDVFEVEWMMATRDLFEIAAIDDPELHDPPHYPIDHPALQQDRNIFHVIRDAKSLLLQHPYDSFSTSVERFLREASEDPKVRAIKMTLYRTSKDSKVLGYLCDAARNGKQVAVVVELKARFDEQTNIQFANHLEDFGIHVTYGVVGLKTHCKVILVVRQDYDGLRRYAHIGTGNYHAGTARIYTDFGLLTSADDIGHDLTELFNYLTTGYRPKRNYLKIIPAPTLLKNALISKIEREIAVHTPENPGLIQFKMNALEDADITAALYRAAMAGVHIDLITRDTCRLRPGLPGLSDNVRVVSIVGRFLEHGRIYYFRNAGDEEYLIGSADCMKRNLESRVEVVAPVEDAALRAELREVFDTQLLPNRDAWEMQPDGSYVHRAPAHSQKSSQQAMINHAQKRHKKASRLRKRRPKGFARRPQRESI